MRQRMGRPGLLGTVARTAVITGTATAVSGGMQRRAMSRQAEQEQAAAARQQAAANAAANQAVAGQRSATAGAQAGEDPIAKLKELAALKDSGVLTDEEFTAAKAKLLGI